MDLGKIVLSISLMLGWLGSSTLANASMYDSEYQACADRTTVDIVDCITQEAQKWETRLNRAYSVLIEGGDASQRKTLQSAQRRWEKFRQANCRYYAEQEGSIRYIAVAECRRAMTAERAAELSQAGIR